MELLNETRRYLLLLDSVTFSIALGALFDIVGIISPGAATVRTDNLPVVRDFLLFSYVEFLQSRPNLDVYRWSCLFLLSTAKRISKLS